MKTESANPSSTKQPVLLQVLPSLHSGGVERGTIDITRAAVKAGFKVIVASSGGYMSHQVTSAGGKHITLPLKGRGPFSIWKNIKRLEAVIREYNVDIVHARSRGPAWSAYYAAKRTGAHFVTTMHGNHSTGFPFKRAYNKIMTKGERVIAISEFIRSHMLEQYHADDSRITVIPRGVDLEQFTPKKVTERRVVQMIDRLRLPEDKPVILLPGRLTRWKGQNVLLEAVKKLPKGEFFCLLVGDDEKHPNYRDELRKTIVREGLASSVAMVGNLNDMPALYSLATVVLSTSVRPEAFGRIPAEAGAMGRVVIAPNHGGATEIIQNEKTGFLVEPGNADALADTLKHVLNMSEEERIEMGKKAIARVKRLFTVERMCEDTIALYREVLEGAEHAKQEEPEAEADEVLPEQQEQVEEAEAAKEEGSEHIALASEEDAKAAAPKPKKRGRKKKSDQPQLDLEAAIAKVDEEKAVAKAAPKKRGRPRKKKVEESVS